MSLGKAAAKRLISELKIFDAKVLLDLENICMARGVFVRREKLEGAEARNIISPDESSTTKAIVTVRDDEPYEGRSRFSIAHELGHFELHRKISAKIDCNLGAMTEWFGRREAEQREVDANEFAAELLMPEQFIEDDIRAKSPSLNLIEELCSKFKTSYTAAGKRFIDVTKEACALVVFDDSRILYHWPSKLFREQYYWIAPGKLNGQSYAHDAANGTETPKHMSSIDADVWLDFGKMPQWKKEKLEEATVKEQSKFFPGLGRGLSLVWLESGVFIS